MGGFVDRCSVHACIKFMLLFAGLLYVSPVLIFKIFQVLTQYFIVRHSDFRPKVGFLVFPYFYIIMKEIKTLYENLKLIFIAKKAGYISPFSYRLTNFK